MDEAKILEIISEDSWMMNVLQEVEKLGLNDWMIGAGFVRNKIWDYMHGYEKRTPLNDIDIIYMDREDLSEETEEKYQEKFSKKYPEVEWSFTNQARMHIYHNDESYKNCEESLSKWVEEPTCIAVYLEDDKLKLVTPYGVDCFDKLEVRPSPGFSRDMEIYRSRINKKRWQELWPKLKIYNLD